MPSFHDDAASQRPATTKKKQQSQHGAEQDQEGATSSSWNGNAVDEEAFIGVVAPNHDSPTKQDRSDNQEEGNVDEYTTRLPPAVVFTIWIVLVVVMLNLGFAAIVNSNEAYSNKSLEDNTRTGAQELSPSQPSQVLTLTTTCPTPIDLKEDNVDIGQYIHQGDIYKLRDKNATELWEWMQSDNVDGWGRSYRRERARIHDFTVQEFLPHFVRKKNEKNASTIHIYKSACGVGRKLVMTLDIIREELIKTKKVDNDTATFVVVLSGNDYASDSAEAARTIIGSPTMMEPFFGAKLGTICGGVNSTNLSHITSNSFDIVYTGYVGPLHDPLGLSTEYPERRRRDRVYRKLCRNATKFGKNDDSNDDNATKQERKYYQEAQEQVQRMIQIQEDWYAKWVGEMIRIAKPGSPVLVEEVPVSFCDDTSDNGGVNRDFWLRAAAGNINQDSPSSWSQVDPDSIHFVDAQRMEKRYHVAMKKKSYVE